MKFWENFWKKLKKKKLPFFFVKFSCIFCQCTTHKVPSCVTHPYFPSIMNSTIFLREILIYKKHFLQYLKYWCIILISQGVSHIKMTRNIFSMYFPTINLKAYPAMCDVDQMTSLNSLNPKFKGCVYRYPRYKAIKQNVHVLMYSSYNSYVLCSVKLKNLIFLKNTVYHFC